MCTCTGGPISIFPWPGSPTAGKSATWLNPHRGDGTCQDSKQLYPPPFEQLIACESEPPRLVDSGEERWGGGEWGSGRVKECAVNRRWARHIEGREVSYLA